MGKVIVLLSGGQDSTTCLYWAKAMFDEVEAITIAYGQRHAVEIDAAVRIAASAGVSHRVIDVPSIGGVGGSDLTKTGTAIRESGGFADRAMPQGLPTSFVPGRNAMFLTVAASFAVVRGVRDIVTGVCQTDYSGYPDCREEFVQAMASALTLAMPSGSGPLRIHTPLMHMTKAETVRMAMRLPGCWDALAHSVTCYNGSACGVCPACVLRAKGFADAGKDDPATHAPAVTA